MIEKDNVFKLTIELSESSLQDIVVAFADLVEIEALEQSDESIIIHDKERTKLTELQSSLMDLEFITDEIMHIETIQNKNWNETWEKSFTPIVIESFCGVRASFHDTITDVKHEIIINPELAFGTGHHETTYMMIDQMSDLPFEGSKVLDYGCGTAILSILAEKLGADKIFGIDIDEQSIECAKDCVELNNSNNIDLVKGDMSDIPNEKYDLILANINKNVLMNSGEGLQKRIDKGGYLLLSGVLKGQEAEVVQYYRQHNFEYKRIMFRGEWASILLIKLAD